MSVEFDQVFDKISLQIQNHDVDKKVQALLQLQTLLTTSSTPLTPTQIESITDLLSPLLKASNQLVSTSALSTLSPFLQLLTSQERSHTNEEHVPPHIRHVIATLLPVDKLVDSKERVRESARMALVKAGLLAFHYGGSAANSTSTITGKEKETPWNHYLKVIEAGAFGSKNAKAREQALHILLALRSSTPCPPLRPFTPHLLPLLSDSDGAVRALALSTTITIFSNTTVSNAARIDLKKELMKREKDIGKKVIDLVMTGVMRGGTPILGSSLERRGSESAFSDRSISSAPNQTTSPPTSKITRPAATTSPSLPALPSTAFPSDPSAVHTPTTTITPVYITSPIDLANSIGRMKPCFEGKETESNWIERDKSVAILRGILAAIDEGRERGCYTREEFLFELKGVQDGVLKTASSLRTTLAVSTLSFISELATILGHSFDHSSEPYLSHTLSMAGQTKKIVATASQSTVTSILTHTSYHLRILHLLISTFTQSKIAQARTFLSGHITSYLNMFGQTIHHSGGVEDLVGLFKKGLADPVPAVRENFRDGFLTFAAIWPERKESVLGGLEPGVRKQLEKVLVGRVVSGTTTAAPVVLPAVEKKRAAPRMSVKEMMKAKKDAMAAAPAPSDDFLPTSPPLPIPLPLPTSPSPASASVSSVRTGPPPPTSPKPRPLSSSSIPSPSRYQLPTTLSPPKNPDQHSSSTTTTTTTNSDNQHTSTPASKRSLSMKAPVLPVADKVVDEALKGQAQQAEQAAQRLLELVDDSDDGHGHGSGSNGMGLGVGLGMRTPKNSAGGGNVGTVGIMKKMDVFEDSPVGRTGLVGGKGKGNWWMKKVETTTPLAPRQPDTPERVAQIATLISSIQNTQVTRKDLQSLAVLSKERPVLDNGEGDEEGDGEFWAADKKFSRVWSGLQSLLGGLRGPEVEMNMKSSDQRDAALELLKELVQNQLPCFAGDEPQLFQLLFQLREIPTRTTIAAVDGIAEVLCDQLEPLYGLGALRSSLEAHLAHTKQKDGKAYALGLRLLGKFFERLEEDVLEEELPRVKELIKTGLNDQHSGDLRRAAMMALVAAQGVLQDVERLYLIVDGLGLDQKNLLSYYDAKRAQ